MNRLSKHLRFELLGGNRHSQCASSFFCCHFRMLLCNLSVLVCVAVAVLSGVLGLGTGGGEWGMGGGEREGVWPPAILRYLRRNSQGCSA